MTGVFFFFCVVPFATLLGLFPNPEAGFFLPVFDAAFGLLIFCPLRVLDANEKKNAIKHALFLP